MRDDGVPQTGITSVERNEVVGSGHILESRPWAVYFKCASVFSSVR